MGKAKKKSDKGNRSFFGLVRHNCNFPREVHGMIDWIGSEQCSPTSWTRCPINVSVVLGHLVWVDEQWNIGMKFSEWEIELPKIKYSVSFFSSFCPVHFSLHFWKCDWARFPGLEVSILRRVSWWTRILKALRDFYGSLPRQLDLELLFRELSRGKEENEPRPKFIFFQNFNELSILVMALQSRQETCPQPSLALA